MKVKPPVLVAVSPQTRSWVSKSGSDKIGMVRFESWRSSPASISFAEKLLEGKDNTEISCSYDNILGKRITMNGNVLSGKFGWHYDIWVKVGKKDGRKIRMTNCHCNNFTASRGLSRIS